MLEALYGVVHGQGTVEVNRRKSHFELEYYNQHVVPSRNLIGHLLSLPEGELVGVESSQELLEGKEYTVGPHKTRLFSDRYWSTVVKIARARGLHVAYLDNEDLYQKYLTQTLDAERPTRINDWRRRERRRYAKQVVARNTYEVEREQRMIENLADCQPRIAILGRGHTAQIAHDPTLEDYGIEIGRYIPESIDNDYSRYIAYSQSDSETPMDPRLRLERELLHRKVTALSAARVTKGTEPNFVGTWDLDTPEYGLFELHCADGKFEGTVEDTLGTATFQGIIDGDDVRFVKEYDKSKSAEHAIPDEIVYKGNLMEGTFKTSQNSQRDFVIKRFDGKPLFRPILKKEERL